MDNESLIIAILVVIFIIVCVWHYQLCHQGTDKCGLHCMPKDEAGKEGLHCDCARTDAAMYAWGAPGLRPCKTQFCGQMPYKHPRQGCGANMFNPYWPPFGSGAAYIATADDPYIDVPISRMVGDHVVLE